MNPQQDALNTMLNHLEILKRDLEQNIATDEKLAPHLEPVFIEGKHFGWKSVIKQLEQLMEVTREMRKRGFYSSDDWKAVLEAVHAANTARREEFLTLYRLLTVPGVAPLEDEPEQLELPLDGGDGRLELQLPGIKPCHCDKSLTWCPKCNA